jgi:hypothetical protein
MDLTQPQIRDLLRVDLGTDPVCANVAQLPDVPHRFTRLVFFLKEQEGQGAPTGDFTRPSVGAAPTLPLRRAPPRAKAWVVLSDRGICDHRLMADRVRDDDREKRRPLAHHRPPSRISDRPPPLHRPSYSYSPTGPMYTRLHWRVPSPPPPSSSALTSRQGTPRGTSSKHRNRPELGWAGGAEWWFGSVPRSCGRSTRSAQTG